jgi:NAD+ kinase
MIAGAGAICGVGMKRAKTAEKPQRRGAEDAERTEEKRYEETTVAPAALGRGPAALQTLQKHNSLNPQLSWFPRRRESNLGCANRLHARAHIERSSILHAMPAFTHVAIVGRPDTPELLAPLTRLLAVLQSAGVRADVDTRLVQETGVELPENARNVPTPQLFDAAQAVVACGGDGTMIAVARQVAARNLPIIGINQGRLGFLTDVSAREMEATLPALLSGEYSEEVRALLHTELNRDATRTRARDVRETATAMNDVVLSRGSAGSMIEMEVVIDSRPAYTLRADGLIVSTPTGSTAYALSANGPIVHPSIAAMLMVPVAPHALTNRPLVLPDTSALTVRVLRGRDAGLHCDGQSHFLMSEGDEVHIRLSPLKVQLLHPLDYDYYAMLRRKLAWGETADKFHKED